MSWRENAKPLIILKFFTILFFVLESMASMIQSVKGTSARVKWMTKEIKWKAHTAVYVLNTAGGLLMTLGANDKFSSYQLVPDSFRFLHYEIGLMVIGWVLTLPLVFSYLNYARKKSTKEV